MPRTRRTTKTTKTPNASSAPATSAPFAHVDTVCIDLDGTLVDALAGWHFAFAQMWETLGSLAHGLTRYPESDRVYDEPLRRYMHEAHESAGGGEWDDEYVRAAFRRLLAEHGGSDSRAADTVADRYIELSVQHPQVYPDAIPALDRLAGHVRLAIISNGLGRDQRAKIVRLGLAARFDAIVISEEVGLVKPDPAIFLHTLGALGSTAGQALYVGDNPAHDVDGAHAAGMAAIWICREDGVHGAGDHADARVTGLDEIPGLIGVA